MQQADSIKYDCSLIQKAALEMLNTQDFYFL